MLTTADTTDAGLAETSRGDRVRSGRWVRVAPRTYLVAGHRFSDEARVRAAAAFTGGTVHGVAAAWSHGLVPVAPAVVDVTVPRHRNPRRVDGVRIRRRDLAPADRVGLHDVWVTDVALTVLETAVALPQGSVFLDRALQRRVSLDALLRAHRRNPRRTGAVEAARLLRAAGDRAGSEVERVLLRLLRRHDVRGWRRGYRTLGFELDLAFPVARVAVEVDGWAWHHQAQRFTHDRQGQNVLVAGGWLVLRYTWHQLNDDPARVVDEIVRVVAGRPR